MMNTYPCIASKPYIQMNTGDNTNIKMQDPIIISKSVPTNPANNDGFCAVFTPNAIAFFFDIYNHFFVPYQARITQLAIIIIINAIKGKTPVPVDSPISWRIINGFGPYKHIPTTTKITRNPAIQSIKLSLAISCSDFLFAIVSNPS